MLNTEYNSSQGLTYHKKSQHEGVKFYCNLCKYSATCKSSLRLHIKSVHFKERYPCKLCSLQAARKGDLLRHVKNFHQLNEKITCTECNKRLKASSLKQHISFFHSGTKPQYQCQICTFQTKPQKALRHHEEIIHNKIKC